MDEVRVVEVRAHAKINVFLRVLGRRDDGYHDIETLVLPVSLADLVVVRPAAGVACGVLLPDGRPAGIDPDEDLAGRAAASWVDARASGEGLDVSVEKHIPIAAGLGGGSTDAAAVLLGANRLASEPMPTEELARLAARLGSDVPALLTGGPALVRGRGEDVEPVDVPPTWWVLLSLPLEVRSSDAYAWWDEEGALGPEPDTLLEAMGRGDVERLGRLLFNDLQDPVARRHPEVAAAAERLRDAGALGAVMSGSGPTVAGLARDQAHARAMEAALPGTIAVSAPPYS